jgi:hypothetical protein
MYEFEQDPATSELRVVGTAKVASVEALRGYEPKARDVGTGVGTRGRSWRWRARKLRSAVRWLFGGAWGWLKAALRINRAPRAVVARRLAICRSCPKWNPHSQRCGICGCRAAVKVKLASAVCPDDPPRWPRA